MRLSLRLPRLDQLRPFVATLAAIALIALVPSNGSAAMPEKAIFARCYAQLVGGPVPLDHPDYLLIKAGKKRAVQACGELLERGKLDRNGDLAQRTDPTGKSVLNVFYEFHRTWFPTYTSSQILGIQDEFDSRTLSTMELSSPALALTWALLGESAPYQGVLQGQDDYYAVRDSGGDRTSVLSAISGLNTSGQVIDLSLPVPASNSGWLIGVRKVRLQGILENYSIRTQSNFVALPSPDIGAMVPFNLFQNFGGGIIGQQAFFALNNGHPKGQAFDGALKMPRKWSQTIMDSMMCLTLPSLREADVRQFQVPTSSVGFRRSTSCLSCHSSMDQMAATARHLAVSETGAFGQRSIFIASYKSRSPSSATWLPEGDANFKYENPTGRLTYRSYANGALVDVPVQNIEDLGTKISQTEEFYQCAAKRYFEYFTGINVSLYDTTNPANADLNRTLTARDVKDRAFIETLAANLKRSQSLSQLVMDIVASPYYRSSTFNPDERP